MRRKPLNLCLFLLFAAAGACGGDSPSASLEDDLSSVPRLEVQPNMAKDDQETLHHISQGADVLPYALLKAMRVKAPTDRIEFDDDPVADDTHDATKVSFLDPRVQTRLRMLPDESGAASGPPVGLSFGRAKDTGLLSVGINCAACHVAEWHYTSNEGSASRMRIYGAPNMFDTAAWFAAVFDGLKHNFYRPSFWLRVREENAQVEADRGQGATEDRDGAVQLMKDSVAWLVGFMSEEAFAEKYSAQYALMRGRYYFIRSMVNRMKNSELPQTGWGRLDMPNALKTAVFVKEKYIGATKREALGSASNGSWYFLSQADWFQVNANVSTPVMRDIAETFVAGGVIDMFGSNPTYETSINFEHNAKIDGILSRVVPPAWPSNLARNAERANRGEQVYKENCRRCHEPRKTETGLLHFRLLSCTSVGTDCGYANNYADLVEGEMGDTRLTQVFAKTRDTYYKKQGKSVSDALRDEDLYDANLNPQGRRKEARFQFTNGYRAKPLDGMWATAPFLHNGSVPTLLDLLTPPEERPKVFFVGHRRYDTQRVGIEVVGERNEKMGATFRYDTSEPGNSNAGHTYGTSLPMSDKLALIEFLKGMGAGQREPTTFADPLVETPDDAEASPKRADGRPAF